MPLPILDAYPHSVPEVGQRTATLLVTVGNVDLDDESLWTEAEQRPESEWLIREWDGSQWCEVQRVRGREAAQRLLNRG